MLQRQIFTTKELCHVLDGWIDDGRTDGRTGGRADGWTDGWTGGWMEGWLFQGVHVCHYRVKGVDMSIFL